MSKTFKRIRNISDPQIAGTFHMQHQSLLWLYKRMTGWRAWAWVIWATFVTGTLGIVAYESDILAVLNRLWTLFVLLWVWG